MNEFIWECFLVNSHHSQKYLIVCTNHLCNNDPLLRWHDAARQHKIHILDHSMYLHLVHDYDNDNDDYHHVHLHLVQLLHYFSHLSTCQRYNRNQFKILSKQKDNSFMKIKPKLLLLLKGQAKEESYSPDGSPTASDHPSLFRFHLAVEQFNCFSMVVLSQLFAD